MFIAESPLTCVAEGTGILLDNIHLIDGRLYTILYISKLTIDEFMNLICLVWFNGRVFYGSGSGMEVGF